MPPELLSLWLGEHAFVMFQADGTLGYTEDLSWRVSAIDDDVLELMAPEDAEGCKTGDVGSYRWSLTTRSDTLTLDPIEDECSSRRASLTGTFSRSDCPAFPDDFCLGDLEPGERVTTFFYPQVPEGEWQQVRGAVSYTVPAGWANTWDEASEYLLQPQSATGETGIYMWSEVAIVSAANVCGPDPDPNIERTPAAMAGWVADNPHLLTTGPVAVSIDGLDGMRIDASVRPDTTLPCTGDLQPFVPMFVDNDAAGLQWGFPPEGHKRLFFLDLGEGRTLVISIEAEDEATYLALLDEATEIVESAEFKD